MLRYMTINGELYPMNNKIQIEEAIRCVVIHHQGGLSTMAVREVEHPVIRLWNSGGYELGDDIAKLDPNDPTFRDVLLSVGLNYVEHRDTLITVKVGIAGDTWVVDQEAMSPIVKTTDLIQTLNEMFNEDSDEDYGDPEDY